MAILPVEKEILTFIKSYSEDNNDYRYRSIILPERRVKELDGIITALVSSELKNKKIPIEKLSSYIVFDSWELTPTDKIKNKPQRWERHYKENISLLVLYFEYIKKTIENDGRISELELEYIAKNIRDTLLQYINFKTEYEELIHNLRYDPPAGIVQIDRSTIKHIKLKSYLVRNCHYAPRELIPPVAFEVRQIIETKIYNSFGLRFVYRLNGGNFESVVIPMKVFFDFLRLPRISEKIKFVDDLNNDNFLRELETIYKWSNSFIHTGIFPYYWQIYYALIRIHSFARGLNPATSRNTMSSNSAIQIKRGELGNIQREFEKHLQVNSNALVKWIMFLCRRQERSLLRCEFGKAEAIEV